MSFTTFDIPQRENWLEFLDRIDAKDIYFTPEYCHLYEKNGEGKAQLIIYEEGNHFIYYPFLLREINELKNIKDLESKYGKMYDIITPYGYGGPITNETDPILKTNLYKNFNESFIRYCKEKNIITEFIRFHPLIRNANDNEALVSEYVRNTIYVDLKLDVEEIWANYDAKNRNRIRRSLQHGLQVVHRPIHEKENFINLYYKTMDKKNAYDYYYFDSLFFDNMVDLLDRQIELIEVLYENKVILSCFFMCYGQNVHYHLLGSEASYLKFAPNNFLINYAIGWAKSKGYQTFHLGGGYSGQDSLYKFKKNFNKEGDLPFYIGKRIHNEEIYSDLIKDYNLKETNFFPLYRHPSLLNSSK